MTYRVHIRGSSLRHIILRAEANEVISKTSLITNKNMSYRYRKLLLNSLLQFDL